MNYDTPSKGGVCKIPSVKKVVRGISEFEGLFPEKALGLFVLKERLFPIERTAYSNRKNGLFESKERLIRGGRTAYSMGLRTQENYFAQLFGGFRNKS